MIVYCNSGFSNDITEKNYFIAKFLGGIIYHFQNLSFGESVKEIVHYMACGPSKFLSYYGVGNSYGRRNKSLSSLFTISYETVKELDGKDLLSYVSDELLSESSKLGAIKPKNFNLDMYKESLSEYLNSALQIIVAGANPSEGKILNDDIQQVMLKKFSRL